MDAERGAQIDSRRTRNEKAMGVWCSGLENVLDIILPLSDGQCVDDLCGETDAEQILKWTDARLPMREKGASLAKLPDVDPVIDSTLVMWPENRRLEIRAPGAPF